MTSRSQSGTPADVEPPLLAGEARAGRLVQGVVLTAGLWVVGAGVLAALLGGVGWWRPWLVLPSLVALLVGCWLVARRVPARALPVWSALALLAVSTAAGIWLAATHSEQILPRRDSASYLQAALALAQTGERVVPVDPQSVGGPQTLRVEGLTLESPAFYEIGSAQDPQIQPQFPVGTAAVWSLGEWLGGIPAMLVLPGLVTAVGLLAVGLLGSLTIGVRWGPLVALTAAVSFPLVHTGRSTYSEPLALVTLGAGLVALTVAARRPDPPSAARAALLAGLLVGGTAFLRVDGLRETILLIPVAGLYAARRAAWVRPLLWSAGLATALAFASAGLLSWRYLGDIGVSLVGLVVVGVGTSVVVAALLWAGRRGRLSSGVAARVVATLPLVLPGLVALVGLGLASRPWWMEARQGTPNGLVRRLQLEQGLAADGRRTYDERTVAWLSWWTGPVAVALALVTLVVLVHLVTRRAVRVERLPAWTGALVVAAGSTVLTLMRSGITPDHPWAERRMVTAVLLVLALGVAATAWVLRTLHRRGPVAVAVVVSVVVGAFVLLPTGAATWPHATERVERGSLAAVRQVCDSFRPGDVALVVDARGLNEWPQVLRSQCGVPALGARGPLRQSGALPAVARDLARRVESGGGRLLLVAAGTPEKPIPLPPAPEPRGAEAITALGAQPRVVVDVAVREDERLLLQRPDTLRDLPITVWVGELRSAG